MQITLYTCTSDHRTIDKSASLSPASVFIDGSSTANGTLKNPCSVTDPVITCEVLNAGAVNFNYMYIQEFRRYYFVNDIVILQNNLVEIHAHVDVLFSFMSAIKYSRGFVSRREQNLEPFVADAKRNLTEKTSYRVIEPQTTGLFDPTSNLSTTHDSFVAVLANDPGIGGSVSRTSTQNLVYPGLAYSGQGMNAIMYAMNRNQADAFFGQFYNSSVQQAIQSIMGTTTDAIIDFISYPFQLNDQGIYVGTNPQNILIANHQMTAQANKLVSNPDIKINAGTFSMSSLVSSFLDYEPYTRAILYLPYAGEVEIPIANMVHGVTVTYQISIGTGDAIVSIVDDVTGAYVKNVTCQIGYHVPVTKTNNVEQARNVYMHALSASTSALQQKTLAGGLSVLGGQMVQIGLNHPNLHVTGEKPANELSRMLRYDPYVLIERVVDDSDLAYYGRYVGFPYNRAEDLSTIAGEFVIVTEIYRNNLYGQMMDSEWQELTATLAKGVLF